METVSTLQSGDGRGFTTRVDSAGAVHARPSASGVQTSVVAVGTSSDTLVAAREGRRGIFIANRGASTVYVRFEGAAASAADWPIAGGGTFEAQLFPYGGEIRAINPTEEVDVLVLELWSAL